MSSLVLLFTCLALGIVVAHAARPPAGLAQALNWWVINIALPALVLNVIPRVHFEAQFWFLAVANWLVFIGSWLLFAALGRLFGWSRARIGALTLVGGLGNAAFMGYPMIAALRGAPALSLAVIGDQTGCFVAMVIGGVAVTVIYADQPLRPWQALRRIVLFPAFLALLAGVAIGLAGDPYPQLHELCASLAATLTPLALFSVGLQQRLRMPRSRLTAVGGALAWKLLLAPALCCLLARVSGVTGLVRVVAVLQAGMPPMISAAILADQYGLEPPLAHAALGLGILISLATVPWLNSLL